MLKKLAGVITLVSLLTALFPTRAAFAESLSGSEAKALDYLGRELEASADHLMKDRERALGRTDES